MLEWVKMAFEYPQSYIVAFFAHSKSYFSMYRKNAKVMPINGFYNKLTSSDKNHYLTAVNLFVCDILLYSLFSYHACFLWLILWSGVYLIKFKRKDVWLPFIPVFILFMNDLN